MAELDAIIGLATVTYIAAAKLYELHPMDERVVKKKTSIINKYVLLIIFQPYFSCDFFGVFEVYMVYLFRILGKFLATHL